MLIAGSRFVPVIRLQLGVVPETPSTCPGVPIVTSDKVPPEPNKMPFHVERPVPPTETGSMPVVIFVASRVGISVAARADQAGAAAPVDFKKPAEPASRDAA